MSEFKNLSVNVDAASVTEQYANEHKIATSKRKTEFSTKNYLQARLNPDELTKKMTIRLLPFSPEGGSPFKKVFIHTVKVNKELSPGGWKTFVCPPSNHMGESCPFCEVSAEAKRLRLESENKAEKDKYGDIEFMNRVKPAWIVRCIERGHEEDGVKFWLFNDAKTGKGPYNDIMNIYFERKESAERKGRESNIFDVNNGKDLILTLSKDQNNKTVIKIVDDEDKSPLSESYEEGMAWINDPKQWNEVYTVKSYDYMKIVASGGVPAYDATVGKYVDKEEKLERENALQEAQIKEALTEQTKDYSEITTDVAEAVASSKETVDDLPF